MPQRSVINNRKMNEMAYCSEKGLEHKYRPMRKLSLEEKEQKAAQNIKECGQRCMKITLKES